MATSRRFVELVLLLVSYTTIICSSSSAWGADAFKTFKSKDYSYAVQYPANWYAAAKRPDDPLAITNFPPSKAVHAVFLPPLGAEIMLLPITAFHLHETPLTLEAWISLDTAHSNVVFKRTIKLDDARNGIRQVIEVRTEEDDPVLEAVSWYFQFQSRLFKAMLLYWKENPNGDRLVQTMRQIVLSLKTTSADQR